MSRRPLLPARLLAGILIVSAGAGCVDREAEHRVRANAFLRGGDAAAALVECDKGLAGKKDNVPLHILRGKALFELDRLDEARGAYEAAIASAAREEPRSLAEAYLGLAMIASRQKDWATARRHFEKLVEIHDGADAASHLNVARACLELHDMDCAVTHAELAQRIHGDEEPVLFTLGSVYLAAGKLHEAELTFQHLGEIIPGAASSPYGLALCAARAGDRAKALARLDEAVQKKLPNPEQIASDPGFAPLRDDPEFQRIVARATHP
jgi:tetratricopeptide (TPR) repeat protein